MRAEEGDGEAQYRLGGLLYGQNRQEEGWQWMCLAANNGNNKAMSKLGYWYEHDEADPGRAFAWYNLSASHGNPWAAKYRDNLARKMTPPQIADARKMEETAGGRTCDNNIKD